jgi:hypothetical protein
LVIAVDLLTGTDVHQHSANHPAVAVITPVFAKGFTGEEGDPVTIFVIRKQFWIVKRNLPDRQSELFD